MHHDREKAVREGSTYQMLNRALRLLEADVIVNIGFFVHELHLRIQHLHQQQVAKYDGHPFLVYHGHGLSTTDFEELQKSQGGLMSLNCFLSTNTRNESPIKFAEEAAMGKDKVGLLFLMTIDLKIASIPFADIQEVSCYAREAEILYSMYTVFRIGTINRKADGRSYFEVSLSLVEDDDKQLSTVMKQLDDDTQASNGWERISQLIIKVGQLGKAEELYNTLLKQSSNANDQSWYYDQLGSIKEAQGNHPEALFFYERALEIWQKSLSVNHPELKTLGKNMEFVKFNTECKKS